jgi:hypothetical protein
MKTSDVPHLKEPPVATEKKTEHTRPVPAAPASLARASETSDPAVHQILAEMQTARSNGDDESLGALTEKLHDLGYA